jgi:hypothetical protein
METTRSYSNGSVLTGALRSNGVEACADIRIVFNLTSKIVLEVICRSLVCPKRRWSYYGGGHAKPRARKNNQDANKYCGMS